MATVKAFAACSGSGRRFQEPGQTLVGTKADGFVNGGGVIAYPLRFFVVPLAVFSG